MENEILDDFREEKRKNYFKRAYQFILIQLVFGILILIFNQLNSENIILGTIAVSLLFSIPFLNIIALVFVIKAIRKRERKKSFRIKVFVGNILILIFWIIYIIKIIYNVISFKEASGIQ